MTPSAITALPVNSNLGAREFFSIHLSDQKVTLRKYRIIFIISLLDRKGKVGAVYYIGTLEEGRSDDLPFIRFNCRFEIIYYCETEYRTEFTKGTCG